MFSDMHTSITPIKYQNFFFFFGKHCAAISLELCKVNNSTKKLKKKFCLAQDFNPDPQNFNELLWHKYLPMLEFFSYTTVWSSHNDNVMEGFTEL